MYPAALVFSSTILAALQVTAAEPYAPKGTVFKDIIQFGNGTYFTSENATDWFTARDLCIEESAQLVAFETEEEYNAIRAAITKYDRTMFWTDGVDVLTPRDFYWNTTGLTFNETFANWGTGEPDNAEGNEHCVSLSWWLDHAYNDHPCFAKASFICELNS